MALTVEELFEQLQRTLDEGDAHPAFAERLMSVIKQGRKNKKSYESTWLPVLENVKLPEFVITDLRDARSLGPSLPKGARVALRLRKKLMGKLEGILAGYEGVAGFQRLELTWADLGDADLFALGASPALRNLTSLEIVEKRLSVEAINALVSSSHLTLRSLKLRGELGPEAAQCIANAPSLAQLQRLVLGHNPLGDDGVIALAQSRTLTNLRELALNVVGFMDNGAMALASSKNLESLTSLDICGNQMRETALIDILMSRTFRNLTYLDFSENDTTDRADGAADAAGFYRDYSVWRRRPAT